jgi:SpoVK/Ycf46/Vps4 family AAA+-type ATPase
LIGRKDRDAHPLQIHLRSEDAAYARVLGLGIAGAWKLHCLELDWRALAQTRNAHELLRLAFREAWLRRLALHIRRIDEQSGEELARCRDVLYSELACAPSLVILSGHKSWELVGNEPSRVVTVDCRGLDETGRRECWEHALRRAHIAMDCRLSAALAQRFDLAATQIESAVMAAKSSVQECAASDGSVVREALFAAARAQTRQRLASLALQIPVRHRWDEIVLPGDAVVQLREICCRVTGRSRVMGEWGFDDKLSLGKGTSVLFSGPSGTGKTMAAEIVAAEVGLDLFKVDLASVVSKYIGETEQNLEKIFAAADGANAIMMFDEADALFGKRSEVRDSHDRYANLEISYLLQRIERYRGIAILTTNLRQNLDEAFLRRLAFVVNFPFPDVADRERIWRRIWPSATPVADDVDFGYLASTFKLSGGNIKNVALAAAFLAANDGDVVTMAHLLHATRREYQKSGKTLGDLPPRARVLATGAIA